MTLVAGYTVEGTLRAVDLEKHTCQVYPLRGRSVTCSFSAALAVSVKTLLDQPVRVVGEVSIRAAKGAVQKIEIKNITGVRQEARGIASSSGSTPERGKELVAALRKSGLVGTWKNRKDFDDSGKVARALRERAQRRVR